MKITKKQLKRIIREEKAKLRRIIREAVTDTTHAVQRNYTDASGKRQHGQAQRAADRYRVRSGNLSSANWNDPVNNPQTAADWKNWSKTFNLDVEHDNEGQVIFYIDDAPDGVAIAKEASRSGADVQTDDQGRAVVIYTGAYDENL